MWNDFNSAKEQSSFDIIPAGTVAPVRMTIKPGGFDNANLGWTGGYATQNDSTGAVYLHCEFIVLEGEYIKRKIWSMIGLYSSKGPEWQNIGRSFIRGILNSAHGLSEKDNSEEAQKARRISAIANLDGIEFIARIDVKRNRNGGLHNEIRFAVTPDCPDYLKYINAISNGSTKIKTYSEGNNSSNSNSVSNSNSNNDTNASNLPHWAKS